MKLHANFRITAARTALTTIPRALDGFPRAFVRLSRDSTETLASIYGDSLETLLPGTGEQGNRGTGEQGKGNVAASRSTATCNHANSETPTSPTNTNTPKRWISSRHGDETPNA